MTRVYDSAAESAIVAHFKEGSHLDMENVSVPIVGPGGITGRRTTVELCCRPYTTAAINRTIFHANGVVNSEAVFAAERMLDHMVSGMARADSRPVKVHIAVIGPLTAIQANALNDASVSLSMQAGTLVGIASGGALKLVLPGPFGTKVGGFAGTSLGKATQSHVRRNLPYYHAGDLVISAEGEASGGIGPQHSYGASQILQRTAYDGI
ncbi:hypothetical protein [Pseudomonas sp. RIT-PI-AD]|uniref:hypothetical protein n=1 Tax=Pseudomonas sp. RIT-PI-AD TaxID=3035294 RepID=UPI0021D90897|nr:hypothetical protein [Pseudomonas sp. RIT-PI-AD]